MRCREEAARHDGCTIPRSTLAVSEIARWRRRPLCRLGVRPKTRCFQAIRGARTRVRAFRLAIRRTSAAIRGASRGCFPNQRAFRASAWQACAAEPADRTRRDGFRARIAPIRAARDRPRAARDHTRAASDRIRADVRAIRATHWLNPSIRCRNPTSERLNPTSSRRNRPS
jgi:hypothetical protein